MTDFVQTSKATPSRAIANRRHLIDLLIRFALGLTFAFAASIYLKNGINGLEGVDFAHATAHQIGKVVSIIAVGLYTLMIGCVYIVRLRPISKFAGILPCASAIIGGFLMSGLLFCAPNETLPLWAQIAASFLVIAGNLFAVIILTRLGRSFSILPEGRNLVTTGPYAIVRHPLYVAEAVATLGVVINFLSPWALILVAAHLSLQMVRIHYEEKVLKETFPEYETYAAKTSRLIPGVY